MEYSNINDKLQFMQNTVVLFSAEYSERKQNHTNDQDTTKDTNMLQNGIQITNLGTKLKRLLFVNNKTPQALNDNMTNVIDEKKAKPQGDPAQTAVTHATLHGLNHIVDASSPRGRRGAWALLVGAMFLLYGALAASAILEFVKFDSTTKISTLHRTSMPFPAVSICQQNIIPYSYIQQYPELEYWINYANINSFNDLSAAQASEARSVLKRHLLAAVFQAAAFDFTEACMFDQEELECSDYFREQMSETTGCYTFMPQEMVEMHGEQRTTTPGYPFGLRMSIYCYSILFLFYSIFHFILFSISILIVHVVRT